MTMPDAPRISGEAFAVERLRENPELDFAALRAAAEEAGIVLQPIQFGRAKKQLGLTKPKDETSAPKVAAAARAAAPAAAAPSKGSPTFEWIVDALRADPTLSYGELKARADDDDRKIAPIMYGRAKALLGLVPVRERGAGKEAAKKSPRAASAPPRVLKQVESVAADRFGKQLEDASNVSDLVRLVQQLDDERRRLRALLERIADSIDEALGYTD